MKITRKTLVEFAEAAGDYDAMIFFLVASEEQIIKVIQDTGHEIK